jgi:hypothetical protein
MWWLFLQRLRHGLIQQNDINMLQSLIISNCNDEFSNLKKEEWASAPLITPRHAVRKFWNQTALRKWCKQTGHPLFVCSAHDTIHGRDLSSSKRNALSARTNTENHRRQKDLPDVIELAIGMKVMVTSNVDTDLNITNSARGEIVDIILHPNEPPLSSTPIIVLKHPPAFILVKLSRTRAPQLDGLSNGVVPVEVSTQTLQILMKNAKGKIIKKTIKHRQFLITAAYAFTDYRSQGQTIPYAILDLASPPTGKLTLFNLYVALSHSKGHSSVRLLQDFDDKVFKQSHDPALILEDERLESLNEKTKTWWNQIKASITN